MNDPIHIDAGSGNTFDIDRDDPDPVQTAAEEIARLERDAVAFAPSGDGADIDYDDEPVRYWFVMRLEREGEYRFALPAGVFPALDDEESDD
jgi:hypothetical protein